jgi:predicted PurR-regulated permease PerM
MSAAHETAHRKADAGAPRPRQARQVAALALTAVLLLLCWRMLEPFLSVVVWASVLAILFYPAYRFILRFVKRRALASFLSVLLVAATVIGPLIFVSSALLRQLADVADKTRQALDELRSDPERAKALQDRFEALRHQIDLEKLASSEQIQAAATTLSQAILARSAGFVGGLLSVLVSILFTVFTLFYLFRDGAAIAAKLPDLLPLDRRRAESVVTRAHEIITASVYGVLVIAIVQGTLAGVMFAILGIPSALVWGVVMVILSTIPMAGSGLIWGPAVVFLAVSGSYTKAVILTVWGVAVIGTIDNILRPRLVGSRTRMHELFVFFSVLGGLAAFGIIGLLLGPVILGVAIVFLGAVFGAPETTVPAATD